MRLRETLTAGLMASTALLLSGCFYQPAPAPYYAPPAPYYGYAPGYYAPGYYAPGPYYYAPSYGPSVGLGFRFGGGGHRHWR